VEIIDAHHHLWDTDHMRYTLFDGIPTLKRPFTVTDYEAVAAPNGVVGSVCVEAASAGADGLQEIHWLLEQASQSTLIQRVVALAPIEQPDLRDYLDQLAELNESRNGARIVGVRRSFEFEPPDFPRRDETIAGVKLAAKHGYSVDLVLFNASLSATIELVKACPEARFILDHIGKPSIKKGLLHPWREHIEELAKLDNVVCKISGVNTEADQQRWTPIELLPYIKHAIRCFGWDRVMFGSDWPICTLAGTYEAWLEALNWALDGTSEADRRKLFCENARQVYRFDTA
jgi:L-fuconolactonase